MYQYYIKWNSSFEVHRSNFLPSIRIEYSYHIIIWKLWLWQLFLQLLIKWVTLLYWIARRLSIFECMENFKLISSFIIIISKKFYHILVIIRMWYYRSTCLVTSNISIMGSNQNFLYFCKLYRFFSTHYINKWFIIMPNVRM